MFKNTSATLHFSANYCPSVEKQYSGYRSLLACCCNFIYSLMRLAWYMNFVGPLSSGKGHFVKKSVARFQSVCQLTLFRTMTSPVQSLLWPILASATVLSVIFWLCCLTAFWWLNSPFGKGIFLLTLEWPQERTGGSKNVSPSMVSFQDH